MGYQIGTGIGYSKKESQQQAAKRAIKRLRNDKSFQQVVYKLQRALPKTPLKNVFGNLPFDDF